MNHKKTTVSLIAAGMLFLGGEQATARPPESYLGYQILQTQLTAEEGTAQKARSIAEADTMSTTLKQLMEALGKRTSLHVLGKESGATLLVAPALGARVLAAGVDGIDGANLFWVSADINKDEFWKGGKPLWNAGGLRTWIAPEDAFYLDKEEKWFVPAQMDPGDYKLVSSSDEEAVLENKFNIQDRQGRKYTLAVGRRIRLLPAVDAAIVGRSFPYAKCVAFEVTNSMTNLSSGTLGEDLARVGLWSLMQVNPSGTMIIPLSGEMAPEMAYRDYFNPVPPERMWKSRNCLTVKIDGKYRCKLGMNPWNAQPSVAYLSGSPGQESRLFVKRFAIEPDGTYLDHPWGKPADYGDAIQIYNDDGNLGGFAELECHAPSHKLAPGETMRHTVQVMIFVGDFQYLLDVGSEITKTDLMKVRLF